MERFRLYNMVPISDYDTLDLTSKKHIGYWPSCMSGCMSTEPVLLLYL